MRALEESGDEEKWRERKNIHVNAFGETEHPITERQPTCVFQPYHDQLISYKTGESSSKILNTDKQNNSGSLIARIPR